MSDDRTAVITGRGVVSSLGGDWGAFVVAVRAGTRPCATPFPGSSGEDAPLVYAAPRSEGSAREEPLTSIVTAAVREALTDAGIETGPSAEGLDDVGLVMNTVLGPSTAVEAYLERLRASGPRASRPAQFVDTLLSMPASRVGIALKLRGSTGVVGGTSPFELALDWVRSGREHTVVAGGGDYFSPKCARYYRSLADGSGAQRPLLAQGAAFVVLEDAAHAAERGAPAGAELLGAGAASEAQDVAVPWSADEEGRAFAVAMRAALADAGLEPEAVRAIALAAGDDASERGELVAVRAVFDGGGAPELLRPKRAFGEALGASAGMSLLAALATYGADGAQPRILINAFESGGAATSLVVRVLPS